ncbi:MAG: hypothetical protein KDI56_14780, partial [Xanthomonadales bacterium]|nr:hypothetical protein [Xanthomonadales bacterium]
ERELAEIIEQGLRAALIDGSLLALFDDVYGDSLRDLAVASRHVLRLADPASEVAFSAGLPAGWLLAPGDP